MFGKTEKTKTKTRREITTLIAADTRITGDVEFSGGLHVDGRIVGNVTAADDTATISISEDAVIEGNVHAPEVALEGTVKGDVTATKCVELGATAKVVGNVIYRLIEMAIGAEVNGKLVHEASAQAAAGPAVAEEETPEAAETTDKATY
jgi:cytoskeletal protein CcmA (bactofilin family)